MALPPLVTVVDLRDLVGAPISDDKRAEAVLSRASALVRSYTGQTWVDATTGVLSGVPDDVQTVVLAVAERIWTNPSGAIQITKGPFTTRLAESAGEGLYLTDTEKAILGKYRLSGTGGLWTMQRTRGDAYIGGTQYVPTGPPPSGDPFPWYADDVTADGLTGGL
jgi:hypothetical protein